MLDDRSIVDLARQEGMIEPFSEELLQPASYEVTLGAGFLTLKEPRKGDPMKSIIDPSKPFWGYENFEPGEDGALILEPGEFLLAHTQEIIRLPGHYAARVEGKSSLGRLGLLVHATAGFIDPGFRGQVTLELKNLTNYYIKLYVGMKIGQLTFERLANHPFKLYGDAGNSYQDQMGVTPSRGYQSFRRFLVEEIPEEERGTDWAKWAKANMPCDCEHDFQAPCDCDA